MDTELIDLVIEAVRALWMILGALVAIAIMIGLLIVKESEKK